MKLIGLSLSFCVLDILQGKVKKEDVGCIIPGFPWTGKVHDSYYTAYWWEYSRDQVNQLLAELNIQNSPNGKCHNVGNGYWMESTHFPNGLADESCRITI